MTENGLRERIDTLRLRAKALNMKLDYLAGLRLEIEEEAEELARLRLDIEEEIGVEYGTTDAANILPARLDLGTDASGLNWDDAGPMDELVRP